jgi:putative oxidoreductase
MNDALVAIGRIGLSLLFIISGWGKIAAYAGTQQYMEAAGVPGMLLPLVIAVELGGGIAILLGFFTRWVSLGLAVFTLIAGLIFHATHMSDPNQAVHFWKNVAVFGGFCVLAVQGAGAYSIDAKRRRR